jgi:transposase
MTEADEQRGDEEIATCHMCGQTFSTQVELSQHLMDAHHDDGLPTPERA